MQQRQEMTRKKTTTKMIEHPLLEAFDLVAKLYTPPNATAPHDCSESYAALPIPEWAEADSKGGHRRRLPHGRNLKVMLVNFFRQQEREVLGELRKGIEDYILKAKRDPLDDDRWTDVSKDDAKLAGKGEPRLRVWYEESAKDSKQRLKLDSKFDRKISDRIKESVKQASFKFSRETNKTTTLSLKLAREKLRRELQQGLISGDSIAELTKRVKKVFKDAEKWRAERIARTESARAVHAAQLIAAQESGVVAGFKWLASSDACPICLDIAASNPKGVALGANFAEGDGPYGDIPHPPAHPNCTCTVVEILSRR